MAKLVKAAQIRNDANWLLEIEHRLERFFVMNLATKSTLVQVRALQMILKKSLANEPELMISQLFPTIMSICFPVKE